MTSRFNPAGSDGLGRFYSRESGLKTAGDAIVRADSVALERWNPKTGKLDTVAFTRVARPGPLVPGRGQLDPPFTTGVQWAVAQNGRVALVYPDDYHVEFVATSGARSIGRPIAFSPIKVSEAHKQQWRDERRPACGGSLTMGTVSATGRAIQVQQVAMQEPSDWPDELPPFLSGAASFAPDGRLWVHRTTPANDPPSFDLIDQSGQVVHRITLPPRARLLGFGTGSVYVIRVDDDDLQYVQRHRLP